MNLAFFCFGQSDGLDVNTVIDLFNMNIKSVSQTTRTNLPL